MRNYLDFKEFPRVSKLSKCLYNPLDNRKIRSCLILNPMNLSKNQTEVTQGKLKNEKISG
ncbi:hypothetical protein C922_04648 [Plasmodium inui San Antonio 1]|uniref:Uncharacterized protein n=1 Tax=Plasmodium inui San Antonio 1 TaxID=1237626 RepID=W7AI09_9APIC|nr:hypothetical protein C922_04648 [Plasmodium inui San Antonio 1]EUD64916.1 hypothetical protein C922_04648 [Plasmodium inui San Antonio 1]